MKAHYILTRLFLFLIGLIFIRFVALYTLPQYIREDEFGFIAELNRIFAFNFIFSLTFLIYTLFEVRKQSKKNNQKLRNKALLLSIIATAITILFFIFYKMYS